MDSPSLCLILTYRMTSNQTVLSDRLTVTAFVVSLWSMQSCISFTDSNQISLLRHQNSKVHYTQLSSVPFSDSKVAVTLPCPMMTLGTHRASEILPSLLLSSVEGGCYPAHSTFLFATREESRKSEALTPLGTQVHVPGFYEPPTDSLRFFIPEVSSHSFFIIDLSLKPWIKQLTFSVCRFLLKYPVPKCHL